MKYSIAILILLVFVNPASAEPKLLRTIKVQSGIVTSLAFSPDGKTLASGDKRKNVNSKFGGFVELWDVSSGKRISVLKGHKSAIYSVAYSPDGKLIAAVGGVLDQTVKLWEVSTGKLIASLKGHKFLVMDVAFSPNGKILASASRDGFVKLWDVKTRKNLFTLGTRYEEFVWSLAFNPNGKTLAVAGWSDNSINIWDVATGKKTGTLKGHKSLVLDVAYSPDGKLLASVSYDQVIKIWSVKTKQQIASLKGYWGNLLFTPDGKTLISSWGKAGEVKFLSVGNFKTIATIKKGGVAAISPDGKTLAIGRHNGKITLWRLTSVPKIKDNSNSKQ